MVFGKSDSLGNTNWLNLGQFHDFFSDNPILGHCLLKTEALDLSEFDEVLENRMEEFDFEAAEEVMAGLLASRYAQPFRNDFEFPQGNGKGFFMGENSMFIPLLSIKVI